MASALLSWIIHFYAFNCIQVLKFLMIRICFSNCGRVRLQTNEDVYEELESSELNLFAK